MMLPMVTDDIKKSTTPLDPNTNADDVLGDPYGLTGVTTTYEENIKKMPKAESNMDPRAISDAQYKNAMNQSTITDDPDEPILSDTQPATVISTESGNETLQLGKEQSTFGEQSASGDMPDPESDDDVTAMAQEAGLYQDEDENNPSPLDIASQVDQAERKHRES